MTIYIYTEKYTRRFKYIAEHIFKRILREDVIFLRDLEKAKQCKEPLICYSRTTTLPKAINICPHGLLFQSDIRSQEIAVSDWEGTRIFFQTGYGSYDVPFDIFSASFYLLSRYEEYGAPVDEEGRYKKENSLAYKNGFLDRPVVDEWAYRLEKMIVKKFRCTPMVKIGYRVHSSVVIDNYYKYRHCSILTNIGKLISKFFRGDFKNLKKQLKVMFYIEKDPYSNMKEISAFHNDVDLTPSFFVMVKKGKKDCRNKYSLFWSLSKSLRRMYVTGLHPSYGSGTDTKQMAEELKKLENDIVKNHVSSNLFHQLKFEVPASYESLLKIGIEEDYSMGYYDAVGFRAGTCTPFRFYDIKHESKTRLRIHNLVFSDRTLREMGVKPNDMATLLKPLIDRVKAVEGQLCCAISNCAISDSGRWQGWKTPLSSVYRYASLLETNDKSSAENLTK